MPIAAYGGRTEIMSKVAPLGPVYQAGTLSGHPVAVASGLKTLELISKDNFFESLHRKTKALVEGFSQQAQAAGLPLYADCEGGMFGFFFNSRPVTNFAEAKASDNNSFKKFFWGMLDGGVYLAPSAFEAGFVSAAHSDKDIEDTIRLAGKVFRGLK